MYCSRINSIFPEENTIQHTPPKTNFKTDDYQIGQSVESLYKHPPLSVMCTAGRGDKALNLKAVTHKIIKLEHL